MKAMQPYVNVPGDNEDRIMARSGTLVGMNPTLAVWRFGFRAGSGASKAYGTSIVTDDEYGFLWVLATRKQANVRQTFRGYEIELPTKFRKVIDWEPS